MAASVESLAIRQSISIDCVPVRARPNEGLIFDAASHANTPKAVAAKKQGRMRNARVTPYPLKSPTEARNPDR